MRICLGYSLKSPYLRPWEHFDLSQNGILISAYEIFHKPKVRERIESQGIHEFLGFGGYVVIDSGGYQLYYGNSISYTPRQLAAFYNKAKPDLAISLDYPTTLRDDPAQFRHKIKLNYKCYRTMRERVLACKLVPVCHSPREVSVLEYECYSKLGAIDCLGIAGISQIMMRTQYRREVVDFVKFLTGRHTHDFHLFGWGAPTLSRMAEMLNASSVDTSSWRKLAAYGKIILPGLGERHASERQSKASRLSKIHDEELEELAKCRCPICTTGKPLEHFKKPRDGFRARAIHNAYVLTNCREIPKKYKVLYNYFVTPNA
jgi:7-cyano-7-deazaguanine tRNA-ribosyltransferase